MPRDFANGVVYVSISTIMGLLLFNVSTISLQVWIDCIKHPSPAFMCIGATDYSSKDFNSTLAFLEDNSLLTVNMLELEFISPALRAILAFWGYIFYRTVCVLWISANATLCTITITFFATLLGVYYFHQLCKVKVDTTTTYSSPLKVDVSIQQEEIK